MTRPRHWLVATAAAMWWQVWPWQGYGHCLPRLATAPLQHTAAPPWKFFLYLTSWARLLAATHYLAEAALVTRRWRAESRASNEGLRRFYNHGEGRY